MHRGAKQSLEVLLVHPGGPFWRNKDDGAWSIPKGEIDGGEDPESVAQREFKEELGSAPAGRFGRWARSDSAAANVSTGSPSRATSM
jgi:predicted NUDIX family NTP pyrophosphohydrolase